MTKFRHFIVVLIVNNLLFISWTLAANEKTDSENWVKVEKSPIVEVEKNGKKEIQFLSYKQRRNSWGFRIGISGNKAEIDAYPTSTTSTVKLKTDSIDAGLQAMISYNLPIASIGLGFSGSSHKFTNDYKAYAYGADAHIFLDGIFENPILVPYAKVGLGQVSFDGPSFTTTGETEDETTTSSGDFRTKMSLYYTLGLLMSLDWIDKAMSMDAFFDYGVQGTFLFIEYNNHPGLQPDGDSGIEEFSLSGYSFGLQIVF